MPASLFAAFAWMVIGFALCAAELFIPGAFLLWIGLAAVALGLVELLVFIPFEWSLLIFAALAVVFSLVGRKVYGGSRVRVTGVTAQGSVLTVEPV